VDAEKKNWDLASVASIPLIMTLGNSMLIPTLPTIKKTLGVTSFQVSMIITVYSIVAILFIPLAGYLSDQYGRKKVIIPALIIAAVGGLISGLAAWWLTNSYWLILVGRLFQGVGAAGAAPIVMPLVGDMFNSDEDVSSGLGLIETANTFGKVLSPIVGAALAMIVWYLPFLAIPLFCSISILMVLFFVKTPSKQDQEKQPFSLFIRSIREIFAQKGRWLYAIFAVGGIAMFVVFGSLFYLSSLLEDRYGVDGVIKGLILAIPLLALCIASYGTGKGIGSNKILMKWIAFSGCLLVTVAISVAALFTNIYYLLAALFVGGIGIGLCLPCLDTFITEGIDKQERGTISSLYSSMRFIGVSAGPPVVSILEAISHRALFFTISGVCAVAAVLALFAIKPLSNTPEERLSPERLDKVIIRRKARS
jgi:ACDE family multidrug resistance protein